MSRATVPAGPGLKPTPAAGAATTAAGDSSWRLEAKAKGRRERVALAFNQLFLTGMAKAYDYQGGPGQGFEEMKTREGFESTEILRRSQMEDWVREFYKPKAEFICVGSELAMSVWPLRIIKPAFGQLRLNLCG